MITSETIQRDIEKLERLIADLQRALRGDGPTAEDLAEAPIIQNWRFSTRDVTCLHGIVIGHPLLGMGPTYTSELYALADDLTWARTYSRFYRLSNPDLGGQHHGD